MNILTYNPTPISQNYIPVISLPLTIEGKFKSVVKYSSAAICLRE